MRSRSLLVVLSALVLTQTLAAEDVVRVTVNVRAQIHPRTSLTVSSERLQFDVAAADVPATAAIDVRAAARVPSDADIVLSIEPLRAIEGPGGAADTDAVVSVAGDGDGLQSASMVAAASTVVGRWRGSGVHDGRLIFTLRADAAGVYSLPVRFVLSMP